MSKFDKRMQEELEDAAIVSFRWVTTGVLIGGSVLVLTIGSWFIQGNEFFLYKVFAPKQEQVRREVFEQTKSYKQGMIQELQNMHFEYIKAPASQKDALGSIILHRTADFPIEELPVDLRNLVIDLKRQHISVQPEVK